MHDAPQAGVGLAGGGFAPNVVPAMFERWLDAGIIGQQMRNHKCARAFVAKTDVGRADAQNGYRCTVVLQLGQTVALPAAPKSGLSCTPAV